MYTLCKPFVLILIQLGMPLEIISLLTIIVCIKLLMQHVPCVFVLGLFARNLQTRFLIDLHPMTEKKIILLLSHLGLKTK